MSQSKAHIKAVNKHNSKAYDRLYPFVPKGRKAEIQAAADAQGESLNDFIVTAIDERIEKLGGSGGYAEMAIHVTPMQKDFIEQAAESLNESVDEYLVNAANEHIRRIRK